MIRMSCVLLAAMLTGTPAARAQQQRPSEPATPTAANDADAAAQVAACSRVQPGVTSIIEAALARLDEARQTNSAAAMRSASDDLRAALLDVRAQLQPCGAMQPIAADPHAGHVVPAAQPPAPATTPAPSAANPPSPAAAAPTPAPPAPSQGAAARPPATDRPASAAAPSITLRTVPSPPRGATSNQFEVVVRDRQGRPLEDAEVTLQLYMAAMPSMRMPEMRSEVKLAPAGGGRYTGAGQIMMAGPWTVTVVVRQNGREIAQERVPLTAR